jgi:hypothetical protein
VKHVHYERRKRKVATAPVSTCHSILALGDDPTAVITSGQGSRIDHIDRPRVCNKGLNK